VQSYDIVTADLNRDGLSDIIYGDSTGSSFYVNLGNGDGTFRPRIALTSATGSSARGIEIADFNGDGILDLFGTYSSSGTSDLFIGNGDGTFKAESNLGGAGVPWKPTSGDFNGDGALDVAIAAYTGNVVNVRLGQTTQLTTMPYLTIVTQSQARSALSTIEATRSRISLELGLSGAYQSRLGVSLNTLADARVQSLAAAKRIMDADVAEESAELTRRSIIQEAAGAIPAQANQQPSLVLKLLGQ
jgi:flagellin-like hook-associated protein FlgL